jgi:transposase-like protein
MFDWKTNALFWLRNFVEDIVVNKMDTRNFDETRKNSVMNDKVHQFVNNGDLSAIIDIFPDRFKIWSPDHKEAVLDYMMKICFGQNFPMTQNEKMNTTKFHLWLMSSLLNDLEERSLSESPEFQVFNEVYQLLKTHFALNFPNEENRLHRAKTETESPRPVCRECGSTEVNSYGLRWQCKSCGRTWLKNPRRTKHND